MVGFHFFLQQHAIIINQSLQESCEPRCDKPHETESRCGNDTSKNGELLQQMVLIPFI